MEKCNQLAKNLRFYQKMRGENLTEFSAELGIARSTVQSILTDGNTTVDTLVRLHNALHVSLDELVFGGQAEVRGAGLLRAFTWFAELTAEKQEEFQNCFGRLLELLRYED